MTDRTYGVLRTWFPDRGFGFLESDHGGPNVFVGSAAFDHAGISDPVIGERFSFEIRFDNQNRPKAWDVEHAGTAKAARQIFNPIRP